MQYKITTNRGTEIIEAETAFRAYQRCLKKYPYENFEVETHSAEQEDRQRYADIILENNTIL